jgi:hypothetical protein
LLNSLQSHTDNSVASYVSRASGACYQKCVAKKKKEEDNFENLVPKHSIRELT